MLTCEGAENTGKEIDIAEWITNFFDKRKESPFNLTEYEKGKTVTFITKIRTHGRDGRYWLRNIGIKNSYT